MATTARQIKLSSTVTLGQYLAMEKDAKVEDLVRFHRQRLHERYILPVRKVDKPEELHAPNGFALTALACLLIETLESFHLGLGDSRRKSEMLFESFFQRHQEFEPFWQQWFDNAESILTAEKEKKTDPTIRIPERDNFYVNVRCGILHQGETKAGWLVRRRGPLFAEDEKALNATKFHYALERAFNQDVRELADSPWSGTRWRNFRKKMKVTVNHARLGSADTQAPG